MKTLITAALLATTIAAPALAQQPPSNVQCVLEETQYYRQLLAQQNGKRIPGDDALAKIEMAAIANAIEQKCRSKPAAQ